LLIFATIKAQLARRVEASIAVVASVKDHDSLAFAFVEQVRAVERGKMLDRPPPLAEEMAFSKSYDSASPR